MNHTSQASEDKRSLPAVIIHTLIWMLTTVFSIAGNLLVLLALYRNRRLRTITNFYVLSLVVIDIIMATLGYPFNMIASGFRKWPFGFDFCQFNGFLSHFWTVVSINILTLTAINRYFCMIKPHFYPTLFTKKKTVVSIIFVWLCTLAAGLAVTLITPVSFKWHPHYLFCQLESSDTLPAFTLLFLTGFVSLLICLTLVCYGRVYCAIRRHNSTVMPFLQDANAQGISSVHEIQASRVLLSAVLTFCICWIPTTIVSSLERVAQVNVPSFWQSFDTLGFASSSWINPIVYTVMSRAMRKAVIKLIRCGNKN